MTHLETYLSDLHKTRATGEAVKETSYYPALSKLLDAVGSQLKPKVNVVINTKNRGAGLPDGGLFTATQLRKLGGDETLREPAAFGGQQPECGVLEVKGTGEEVRAIAQGEQVGRYLKHYGQVLVTNLREFLLVGREPTGATRMMEGYALAESEKEFWRRAAHPQEFARARGAARRVSAPRDVEPCAARRAARLGVVSRLLRARRAGAHLARGGRAPIFAECARGSGAGSGIKV
jgi:hypothetical protein